MIAFLLRLLRPSVAARILSEHHHKTERERIKAMAREVIKIRRMEKHARDEFDALIDTYRGALGL